MTELLPCPFCYSPVDFLHTSANTGFGEASFICKTCESFTILRAETVCEANKKWNTRASGWISVKERLPQRNKKILVFSSYITLASLSPFENDETFTEYDTGINVQPTHWMPLPAAPNVEGE